MFPILFKIGDFSFSSLGIFVGLGFFIAFFIIWQRLKEIGIEEERAVDGFLFLSLSGLVFSRIFYIGINFADFGFNLAKWFYFNRFPGFSFWGAILGVGFGFWYFSQKQKWNFFKVADELTFGLLAFSFLAHVGFFLDGGSLGAETGMFWGLFFPGDMVRRHPISLFEALLFLVLWLYFVKIERTWRTWEWYKSKKEGFLLLNFLIFVSLFEFLLAFLKPSSLYSISLVKLVSFLSFVTFGASLYHRSGRKLEQDFLQAKKALSLKKTRES